MINETNSERIKLFLTKSPKPALALAPIAAIFARNGISLVSIKAPCEKENEKNH